MKRLKELSFYEILEVSPKATQAEIRRAYERAKGIYNRDSLAIYSLLDDHEIEEMSRLIEKAYETVGNEKRRREYNQTLGDGILKEAKTAEASSYNHLPPSNAPEHPDQTVALASDQREMLEELISQPGFVYTGQALREIRETLGFDLREISMRTKVTRTNLGFIEAESFIHLPALVYLRGFISEYAKCLGLDPLRVLEDYVNRYRQWEREKGET